MYQFPKDLYTDIRIDEESFSSIYINNGEKENDSASDVTRAMIRVYDGVMWYTSVVNDLTQIQTEIDSLALLATPNPKIYELPAVKNYEVHKETLYRFQGDKNLKNITREQKNALLENYINHCVDASIDCMKQWFTYYNDYTVKKQFYSSKGAKIHMDYQAANFGMTFAVEHNGITTYGGKNERSFYFDGLLGLEEKIIQKRDRLIDFSKNSILVTPGSYTCVLAPCVTAMFTHESFGHKSEADFMLNDQTLRDEWVMNKKVGSELVTIIDDGEPMNNGYAPYDDEGTKARKTYLIKDGVLTGRLHDANSAATLNEELTGNARAQNAGCAPMVRMTNTYMLGGTSTFEEMISGISDGIYVYDVSYGTGSATFTMKPIISYKIENGKITTPLRINVLTGSVFKALFDIDAIGNDFVLFDTFSCGKNGQGIPVSAGGPTIRVKSLTVN